MPGFPKPPEGVRSNLDAGLVIPAHPLALTRHRSLDERRQRALTRYYLAAGAGGVAVGVHTTQFAIRRPEHDLLGPVLELAAETVAACDRVSGRRSVLIAGICGETRQAVAEAHLAARLGYHAGLVSLGGFAGAGEDELLAHCRTVAGTIPLFGFFLQPAAGGRLLPYSFWCRFAEIENVVAIKIAPFNRYQTIDVIRAIAEVGRDDIALYTGNDDSIVVDLLTPFRFHAAGHPVDRRIAGGLLGHWAVWTKKAVALLEECHSVAATGGPVPASLLRLAIEVTDANAAFFDAAHGFAGCIPGLHEVLRRQRLLEGIWCLDPAESLSPGQTGEIDRVLEAYPHLNDDEFVCQHLDDWLS
jgi:hypothetical protein